MATPDAEVEIDVPLVVALLEQQHPDLAREVVRPLATGWDNALFRVGPALVARLPRRRAAVPLILHERRWLPELGPGLPLPIPVPVRDGAPGCGYPWPWSISPWLPGAPAETSPPADPVAAAELLGRFLARFRRPAVPEAPRNPFRGVPLVTRDRLLEDGLARLGEAVDAGAVRARWATARATPPWPGPPMWLHGDLHPLNVLVHDGALAGVIDFGDLTAGDPAGDLAVAWMMFAGRARDRFREAAAVDDDTWRRAHGWALALGVALANGDHLIRDIGLRTLGHALADAG